MKLFYSPGACSLAAHIALEEVGAKFEAVLTAIGENRQRSPGFLALNPQGRVPIVIVEGCVLTELSAILLYVDRRWPEAKLMPDDPWDFARAISLMNFLASTVHIRFACIWHPERFTPIKKGYSDMELSARANLLRDFAIVESRLPNTGWVGCERFSLADMNLLPLYRWGWRVGLHMEQFARYTRLVDEASRRPAVQRVLYREGLASLLAPALVLS
jgi:glutathione S-transferase